MQSVAGIHWHFEPLPWPAIVAVLGIAVVSGHLLDRAAQRRHKELAALAQRLGCRFFPEGEQGDDDACEPFRIFRRRFEILDHVDVAMDTLVGDIDLFGGRCRLRCGDYHKGRRGRGTSNITTRRFSYLIVQLPWRTPRLSIRREGVLDKLAAVIGFDDIDFESAEFSRLFYVQSADTKFAREVLHPRMIQFLLAERPPMLDLEAGALCLSNGKRRWRPAEFEQHLAFVRRFAALWPQHLLRAPET